MGFSKPYYFPWLEGDDPGDTRLADLDSKNNQQQQPAANLAQELFGRAYPSAGRIIRNRERQQSGAAGPANARDGTAGGARVSKKKGSGQRQRGARKQGDHHVNAEAVDDEAPALRLYDLNQFPPLK